MTTNDIPALDQLLDPIRDCLTRDVAAKIVAMRADPTTQSVLDDLAERNREGQLTPKERVHYESLIRAGALISVLQAKARMVLDNGA